MNYKQKYQLLLGGIALFFLVAYWLAFGKTWAAYQQVKSFQQQQNSAGKAWQEIASYQQLLQQLESEQNNQHFTQNYLFQKVTSFCQEHQLAIREMPESIVFEQEDMELLHNPIKVTGSYIPMVKLLQELEQTQKLGRVVSVDFLLGKNYQSRQQELTGSIYLQNIQTKATTK